MKPALAWTHPVAISGLPEEGAEFRLEPDASARAALAQFAGVLAVPWLVAVFKVTPSTDGGASVEGSLEAAVTQECGVTLEPFDNAVTEAISVRFVPQDGAASTAVPEDELDVDPPDFLENGTLDLAAVTSEFLALGVDPYPRKPGAVFQAPAGGEKSSAFAALEQLKHGKTGEKG